MTLPDTLETAIAQAVTATQSALSAGHTRLLIEFQFPELKVLPVAQQFLNQFSDLGELVKVFFSDAGAAALARRDWGETPYTLRGINELLDPVQPEDQAFIMVAPTPVEVGAVERVCEAAGDRPCILLNPKLQDVSIVGIGYAGRQLRERFLSQLTTSYYLRPLENGAVFRAFPDPWEVWWEQSEGDYQRIAEEAERPSGERLDQIFAQVLASPAKSGGLLAGLQKFLNALSQ